MMSSNQGAAESGKLTRAALYARVSTADQRPEMQVEELRRVAAQRGWEIVGEYVDVGVSGGKDRRPELDRMIAATHCGKVDVVLVWKFDRFARSVRHLVLALEEFRARSIEFVSIHDGIDTSTPTGKFTFHVMASVAELQRDMIRVATRAGIFSARLRGAKIGRPRVHVDVEAARRLRAAGKTTKAIAATLGCGATTLRRALAADAQARRAIAAAPTTGANGHDRLTPAAA